MSSQPRASNLQNYAGLLKAIKGIMRIYVKENKTKLHSSYNERMIHGKQEGVMYHGLSIKGSSCEQYT